ncbi:VOC family protein [Frigidibacter sp.]|uniref:VOC family protein n=1 Tax=Frigidibacter sp. TaxID=2586418 RepID=UPI002737075C|nr:VOC family protein [Frigidibacter sp.]MDP3340717.1 VOC family protein [Frigidibacter sp.]
MLNTATAPIRASALSKARVAHVALRIRDRESGIAWYRDKLGMQVVRAFDLNGMTFTEMAMESAEAFRLELVSGDGAVERPGDGELFDSFLLNGWHHLGIWVDDVDLAVVELRNRDVRITLDPTDNHEWMVRVAFIADPWGNVIELLQPLQAE